MITVALALVIYATVAAFTVGVNTKSDRLGQILAYAFFAGLLAETVIVTVLAILTVGIRS